MRGTGTGARRLIEVGKSLRSVQMILNQGGTSAAVERRRSIFGGQKKLHPEEREQAKYRDRKSGKLFQRQSQNTTTDGGSIVTITQWVRQSPI